MTLALKKTRAFQVYLRRTIQNQDQTRPTYDSSAYYVRQCRLQLESREWEQRERYANSCIFGRYCQPRLLPGFHIWAVTFFFFLLCWVFVAGPWLSLVAGAGATLHCSGQASPCSGFSCCGAQALGTWTSVVVARGLQNAGSVVVAHRLSCSATCGIFPDQGSNPCPLHWQADSQPLCHQGILGYDFC